MKEHIRIPQTNSPKQTVVVVNYTFTFKEQRTTTFNHQHLATAALSIGPFLTMLPETLQLILGLRGFQMGLFSRWVFCFILTVVCISLSTISTLLNFREKDYHALLLLITDLTSYAASVTI